MRPGASPGIRLRDYATAELAHAIACLAWRGTRMHAGVHQARKSIRRVRATLALGMPALGPGAALIDRALRRVNRGTSKLRDVQALVTTLDLLLEKHNAADPTLALRRARRAAARTRAECARALLAADPDLHDRRARLTTLLAALPALPWSAITAADVHAALQRSHARAEAAGSRAHASGRDADWHRWRRRARRRSQQHRALDDFAAIPHPARKRDKRLAVLLGEAQDCALLREHLGKGSPFMRADRPLLHTLTERRAERLRGRIARAVADPLRSQRTKS